MASTLKVDTIQTNDGTGTIALQNQLSGMTTASLPALGAAQMPAGSVLDIGWLQTNFNSTLSIQTTSFVDVTDLSITMTPKSSSSQYLVQANIHHYIDNHAADNWSSTDFRIRKVVGGTDTLVYESFRDDGNGHGYTAGAYVTHINDRYMWVTPIAYLDTHGASSGTVRYYIQAKSKVSGYSINFNSTYGKSTLYVTEIQR